MQLADTELPVGDRPARIFHLFATIKLFCLHCTKCHCMAWPRQKYYVKNLKYWIKVTNFTYYTQHKRSQDFWLGGGANHKLHAMMSSETSKEDIFVGAKISQNGSDIDIYAVFAVA